MCWGLPGSIAMAPTERFRAKSLAPTVVLTFWKVLPPSVERNSPMPASESDEPLGSPVPTQIVFDPGAMVIEPIAFEGRLLPIEVQVGTVASALLVFQSPPPAVPT